MKQRAIGSMLVLTALLGLSSTVLAASEGDGAGVLRPGVAQMDEQTPQPAPDYRTAPPQPSRVAQGTVLNGSAIRVGVGQSGAMPVEQHPVMQRPLRPQWADIPQLQAGADTGRFVMDARKDTVVPPAALKAWLDNTHPGFRLSTQNNPDAVVEVKGAWDKSSEILTAMGIHFKEIKARELRDISLNNTKVLVINCEGKIPEEAIEPIRQWVVRGGYLISTDWTLHSFIERAFPNTIAWNGQNTDGSAVDALMVARDPSVMIGMPAQRATWKLDQESQMVKVLRPEVVQIIARSQMLTSRTNAKNFRAQPNANLQGILACEFPYGRGRVLHMVGHYDYNGPTSFTRHILPDAVPGAGIGVRQVIATNFLVQGLSR